MDSIYRFGDLLVWTPVLGLLLMVALVSFSRIFERNPATVGLLLAVIFWVWANLTHGFVSEPELKRLLFYLQFAFLGFIPLAWMGTCLRFAGVSRKASLPVLVVLATVALALLLVLWTDGTTRWFFDTLFLPDGSWTFYRRNGFAYYVFVTILFATLVAGVVILLRTRPYYSLLDLRRSAIVLWGVAVPTLAGVVDAFRLVPIPNFAVAPWAILMTAVFFVYASTRGRLFNPTPMAYEIVVQRMPDPVVVMDSTRRPVWLNEAARELWPELTSSSGRRLDEVFPELADHLVVLRAGGEVVINRNGSQYRVQGSPAQDQRSGFEALAFVFHDITGLKAEQNRLEGLIQERTAALHQSNQRIEDELARSRDAQIHLERLLAEKELLLQEVNHRVKNNLQIILSLINLQARRLAPGSAAAEVYAATQGRIRSISLVHDLIYRTEFGNGLDFPTYLEELVRGIGALYSQQETKIEIRPSRRPIQVGVDFSVDFGLIVNELVTNALKHGIVPAGGGTVTVGLERVGHELVLTVHDTGVGIRPELTDGTSLGLSLVRSVLRKYKAALVFRNQGGTLAEVHVPWEDA